MAGNTADNVRVGADGKLFVAPVGTTPPATIADPWTGFVELGFTTEEGVTFSRALTTEQVRAWQTIAALRHLITEVALSMAFTLIQFDKDSLPFWLGGGTVVDQGAGSFKLSIPAAPSIDERVLGLEWTDSKAGATVTNRIVIPRGMVTEAGESEITRSGAVGLPITFTSMDATPDIGYILTNDTAFA